MKKKLGLFVIPMLALGLTGCGETEDEKIEKSFATYLANSDGYTAADLDSDIGEIKFETADLIDGLTISPTKITVSMGQTGVDAYMWQKVVEGVEPAEDENWLYVNMPGEEPGDSITYKVDLKTFNEIANGFTGNFEEMAGPILDAGTDEELYASEVITNLLAAYGLDEDYSVNGILSKFNFEASDFTHLGKGVFELSDDALFDLAEDLTGMDPLDGLTATEVQNLRDNVKVLVTYANNNINNINVTVRGEEDGITSNIVMNVDLTHKNGGISKIALSVESTDTSSDYNMYTYVRVVLGEDEFTVATKMGETANDIVNDALVSLTTTSTGANFKMKSIQETVTMLDVNITTIGNWVSEGSITVVNSEDPTETYGITIDGSEVTAPEETEEEAIDMTEMLLEMMSGAMQ